MKNKQHTKKELCKILKISSRTLNIWQNQLMVVPTVVRAPYFLNKYTESDLKKFKAHKNSIRKERPV